MRNFIIYLLIFVASTKTFSQTKFEFGVLSEKEKSFTVYQQDTTANAVVLYERGDNYFKIIDNRIKLVKEYHVKIKLLNEDGFDKGEISIPFYRGDTSSEKITEIKAKTHNKVHSHSVLPDQFFVNDVSEKWSEMVFTFPKLEKGSIIEYYYKLTSPYIYNFNGWEFQSSIPKLHSEFNAIIPGYYHYNRNLNGSLKLDINEANVKKDCFRIPGSANKADCEILTYVMKNVPPFKTEEEYMLAPSNYISRIDFELAELTRFNGAVQKYTQTWKDVDKEFKTDKNIGKQLSKKNFFQKNVPESLLTEGTDIERAKNIYRYVQDHFTWNKKFGIYRKARVKQAFEKKSGNAAEINMTLINLLNAAGINTQLMLSSTRQRGLPKTSHPVMSDFNYFIVRTTIDDTVYLLDATDKYLSFGMLPYRALNHYGRVMDFKEESFWNPIKAWSKNKRQIRGTINVNPEENSLKGVFDFLSLGYDAVQLKRELTEASEEVYLEQLDELFEDTFEITSHEATIDKNGNPKIMERVYFEMDNLFEEETIYLNPFFIKFFKQNPFTLEKRNYPIDFGYPRNYKYQLSLEIPEGYQIKEMPTNQMIKLGENQGYLKFTTAQAENKISINYDFNLMELFFKASDYEALKAIFKHSVEIQNNTLIVLKKK